MENKLKVVWLCHFSNKEVRSRLFFSVNPIEKFLRRLLHRDVQFENQSDFAQWITNGINEIKNNNEIELHVVSPHKYLKNSFQEFCSENIYYHFFYPSNTAPFSRLINIIVKPKNRLYRKNTKRIKQYVESIHPDIINLFGAENPYYSISVLSIDTNNYPILVSLQTLLNEPQIKQNYYFPKERYIVEKRILEKIDYVSSGVDNWKEYIWNQINPKTIFFKGSLAVAESIDKTICEKVFDFVFFAANVSKGLEEAIESFLLVNKKIANVTMNIIGGISDVQRNYIYDKLKENQIDHSAIEISGRLKTHDDVLNQIKRARIAVIPLKTDYVSGTIREAMSRGVPVVSTITEGTPSLNEKRESILLSKIGDYQAMADNMIKLLESPEYADRIRENAFVTLEEKYSNKAVINRTIASYKAIVDFYKNGTPIPEVIGQKNPEKNN